MATLCGLWPHPSIQGNLKPRVVVGYLPNFRRFQGKAPEFHQGILSPMHTKRLRLLSALILSASVLFAADTPATPTLDAKLSGAGFGFGVGAVYMFGDTPVVSATIDAGGIVRATESGAARVGAILEAHYMRKGMLSGLEQMQKYNAQIRIKAVTQIDPRLIRGEFVDGPMATIEAGENVIRSFGVGWLWSWRRYKATVDSSNIVTGLESYGAAFNLGVSVLLEPKVKTLPDGFKINQAAPAGFTSITLEEKERFGAAIVFSASF